MNDKLLENLESIAGLISGGFNVVSIASAGVTGIKALIGEINKTKEQTWTPDKVEEQIATWQMREDAQGDKIEDLDEDPDDPAIEED